jgi:hypothetical protein
MLWRFWWCGWRGEFRGGLAAEIEKRRKGEKIRHGEFFECPIYLWEEMCIKFISN